MAYYDQIDCGRIYAHFSSLPVTVVCFIDVLHKVRSDKACHLSLYSCNESNQTG
jgi:hypothetical protein